MSPYQPPPPDFIPDGYCDFLRLREIAYFHLYPEVNDDSEISDLLEKAISVVDKEIALKKDAASDSPKPKVQRVDGGGLAPPPSLAKSYTVKPFIPIKHSPGVKMSLLLNEKKLVKAAIDLVQQGAFNPLLYLSDSTQSYESQSLLNKTRGEIFSILKFEFAKRWVDVQTCIRKQLYAGNVVTFYASQNYGMEKFPNRNVWLGDDYSHEALNSGQASPWPAEYPLIKFKLLFKLAEVERHLPRLGSNSAGGAGQSAGKLVDIKVWLLNIYPTGLPKEKLLKEIRGEASDALGFEVKEGTFRSARRAAYQD